MEKKEPEIMRNVHKSNFKIKKKVILSIIFILIVIAIIIIFNRENIEKNVLNAQKDDEEGRTLDILNGTYSMANDEEWWINILAELGKYQENERLLIELQNANSSLSGADKTANESKITTLTNDITSFKATIVNALAGNGISATTTATMEELAAKIAELIDLRKRSFDGDIEEIAWLYDNNMSVTTSKDYSLVICLNFASIWDGRPAPNPNCTTGTCIFDNTRSYPSNYEVQRIKVYSNVESGSTITFTGVMNYRGWCFGIPAE